MPGGRGNKSINKLDPDVRAKVDALIYMGTKAREIYDAYPAVQAVMQPRTLQQYATDLRDDQQLEILLANKRVLNKLLGEFGDESEGSTESQRIAHATVLKAMLGEGKISSQLNGVDAYMLIRKDRRKTEEHELRMRLQAHTLAKITEAARPEHGTGEKVVDLATVAKLMMENEAA